MSREMPVGWRMTTLGAELDAMKGGGTPSRKNMSYWNGAIPWASVKDLTSHAPQGTQETITLEGVKECATNVIPKGTIIIATRMAVGKSVRFPVDVAINQDLRAIFPKRHLDIDFLHQWLRWKEPEIAALGVGTTVAGIRQEALLGIPLALPSLPEQRRIADILSSVDEAIQATEAVIEQTRKLRACFLTEFFHRGNWEERKALPEGWTLELLDGIAKRGSGHTPSKSHPEYWNGGLAWVSLQDTKKLDRVFISETAAEISHQGIANSSAIIHPTGTVVVSRDATVGRSAITTKPMAVSQHFIAWQCSDRLDPYYFYYWLQSMKVVFERIGAGSTIKTIGLPFFKSLAIGLPPVSKQHEVGHHLLEIDQFIFRSEEHVQQLQTMKQVLMSDLLTGRKRVTETLAHAAE